MIRTIEAAVDRRRRVELSEPLSLPITILEAEATVPIHQLALLGEAALCAVGGTVLFIKFETKAMAT